MASILVVDDSSTNRFVLKTLLKPMQHQVYMAENGREALDAVKSARFDLVLMDIMMPIMNGIDATRGIRAFEEEQGLPRTAIVAMTADSEKAAQDECDQAGCDAMLCKPVQKSTLFEMLNTYLPVDE